MAKSKTTKVLKPYYKITVLLVGSGQKVELGDFKGSKEELAHYLQDLGVNGVASGGSYYPPLRIMKILYKEI